MTFLPTLLNTLYFSVGVAILNNFPWQFVFLYTAPFGIRLYTLTKKEECKKIQKKIGTKTSQLSDNNKGIGYSIGYWYIMHIDILGSEDGDRYKIIFVATETTYNNFIKDDEDDNYVYNKFTDIPLDDITISEKPKKNIKL